MKNKKKNSGTTPVWAIRLCALAAISSMTAAADFHDLKEVKATAIASSTVFWGIGRGMAFNRVLNRGLERD